MVRERIDLSTVFLTFAGTSKHKYVNTAQKNGLPLVKMPKFERYLLKTDEDIAPQSRRILQTFVLQ